MEICSDVSWLYEHIIKALNAQCKLILYRKLPQRLPRPLARQPACCVVRTVWGTGGGFSIWMSIKPFFHPQGSWGHLSVRPQLPTIECSQAMVDFKTNSAKMLLKHYLNEECCALKNGTKNQVATVRPPPSWQDYCCNLREDIVKTLPLRRRKAGMSFQVRDLRSAAWELPFKGKDVAYVWV